MNFSRRLGFIFAMLMLLSATVMAVPEYIGESACRSCHQTESDQWNGSHHQLAMQEANSESVLADFNQISFSKDGVVTTFYTKDGRYMVNTDGPDGTLQDFEIAYVFGVYPLQQYMVKFPQGRVQVLDIAWDTRSKEQGGQRWYSLHPDEKIPAGDILHWTGPNMNWNYMCADCHSTNLQKNYDAGTKSYQTSWSEISVSCEACHGPGAAHLNWAEQGKDASQKDKGLSVLLDERAGVSWAVNAHSNLPERSTPNTQRKEIQVCARCHSRRSQLSDDFIPGQPFMNAFHPALLTQGLYYSDGQMQDEVYVWGSFRQSKMYDTGVSCSDCHDPHSTKLKAPGEQVCYQCHAPERYASEKHHFHQPEGEGGSCISCHMPASTLMGVDERNDHSFRIPRPDLSAAVGTPNACAQCHLGQTASWAAARLKDWYGEQPKGHQQFTPALLASRIGELSAPQRLMALAADTDQPGIARATALSLMGNALNQNSLMLIQQALNDTDPLIRQGGLVALESADMQYRIIALPAVWDEVRAVRILAARLLAAYPREQLNQERSIKLDAVLEEYIQSQQFVAERPEAQLNLGGLYQDQGLAAKAEAAYRRALDLQPQFIPAYINLAQLLGSVNRESEANELLSAGIDILPDMADLYHARGLSNIRMKKRDTAVQDLQRAAQLAPDNRRYQYVYAVALQSTGSLEEAISVLQATLERSPDDLDSLYTLVTFQRDAGHQQAALESALKLQALVPRSPEIDKLVLSLQP